MSIGRRQWEPFRRQAEKRLRILDAASSLGDLAALNSNRLESLKGARKGSILSGSTSSDGFVASGPGMSRVHRMLRSSITTKWKEKTMARTPIHPGEILSDELEEIGLSAKRLADVIEVPPNRLYQILAGKRNLTADTALRLSQYFGMSADFWMNLQSAYELDLARQKLGKTIPRIPRRSETSAEAKLHP
jgi:addiction module HigA family antidote